MAASEKNLALMKIQNQRNMLGAANPFLAGGMTPIATASGQIQYQAPGGFSGGNQMDLLFNRKVVKPIRGGAAPSTQNNRRRDNSNNRNMSSQMTFDQFMGGQKPSQSNNYQTASRARASVGAIHTMDRSPIRGGGAPPLVKPGQQKAFSKHMRHLSGKKGVEKSMKQYKANVNASRQMVQQMKM